MSLSSAKIGIIELVICALIWGSLGVIVRSLPYSSFQLVEFRVLIALPIMLVFWYSKSGLEDIKKKEIKKIIDTSWCSNYNSLVFPLYRFPTYNNSQYGNTSLHRPNLPCNIRPLLYQRKKRSESEHCTRNRSNWNDISICKPRPWGST